jgi:Tfp pilus assembly protein PilX
MRRAPFPGRSASNRRLDARSAHGADSGQALIVVIILLTVVAVLTLVAITDSVYSTTTTTKAATTIDANSAASAGVAAALYDVSKGTYFCQHATTKLTTGAFHHTDELNEYRFNVVYYDQYADPEPTPAPTTQPTSITERCVATKLPTGVTFGAAVITATGTSKTAAKTSKAEIEELVRTYPLDPSYVLYSGSSSGLNLSRVQMFATTSPNNTFTNTGIIYSASGVTDVVTSAPANCLDAAIDAHGTINFKGGACSHASLYATKTITLSGAKIYANVNVASGNVTMSSTTVFGDVEATGHIPEGNIVLCPVPPTRNAACTGLASGDSDVGGSPPGGTPTTSNADASNSVTVGTTSEGDRCPGPVSSGGDEVTGCVEPDDTAFTVSPPKTVPLPKVMAPLGSGTTAQKIAYTLWTKAGYAVETTTECTGTGAGTLVSDIDNATRNTVIVAKCAVTFPAGSATTATLKHNVAIFAPDGITVNSGFTFKLTASTLHLYFMVPTTNSGTCNVTFGSGSAADFPSGGGGGPGGATHSIQTFVFTPCGLSIDDGGSFTVKGVLVVGSLSITNATTLTLRHSSFIPPDFSYGYQPLAITRYLAKG